MAEHAATAAFSDARRQAVIRLGVAVAITTVALATLWYLDKDGKVAKPAAKPTLIAAAPPSSAPPPFAPSGPDTAVEMTVPAPVSARTASATTPPLTAPMPPVRPAEAPPPATTPATAIAAAGVPTRYNSVYSPVPPTRRSWWSDCKTGGPGLCRDPCPGRAVSQQSGSSEGPG